MRRTTVCTTFWSCITRPRRRNNTHTARPHNLPSPRRGRGRGFAELSNTVYTARSPILPFRPQYGGSGSTTETTPITYAVAGTGDFFLNMFIPGSVIISEEGYTTYDQPGISLDFGAWDLYSSDWEHLAITWDATADGGT